jgi:hypothetical protein
MRICLASLLLAASACRAELITFSGFTGVTILDNVTIGSATFHYTYTGTLPPLMNPPDVVWAATQGIYPFDLGYGLMATPCILSIQLGAPIGPLAFDFGREGSTMLPVGVRVQRYDPSGQLLSDSTAPASPIPPVVPGIPILEGQFSDDVPGLCSRIDIIIDGDRSSFSIDNIFLGVVPAPPSVAPFLLLLAPRRRRA